MYYVFGGEYYYPMGGGDDLIGFSDDLNEAVFIAQKKMEESRYYQWTSVFGADDVSGLVLEWESRKSFNGQKIFEEFKKKDK